MIAFDILYIVFGLIVYFKMIEISSMGWGNEIITQKEEIAEEYISV